MRHLVAGAILASLLLVLFRVVLPALAELRRKPELTEGVVGALVQPPAQSVAKPSGRPLRVLFVGNSHTFAHDKPRLVMQLVAAGDEARPFAPTSVTKGGATLEQHLAQGSLREPLAHGPWDYVVLQEQQQRLARGGRAVFLRAGAHAGCAGACGGRAHGAVHDGGAEGWG